MTLYSDTVVVLCFSWLVSKLPWDYLHLPGLVDYAYYLSLHPLKLMKNVKQEKFLAYAGDGHPSCKYVPSLQFVNLSKNTNIIVGAVFKQMPRIFPVGLVVPSAFYIKGKAPTSFLFC